MYFKIIILAVILLFAFLPASLVATGNEVTSPPETDGKLKPIGETIMVDKIAAVVDEEIITFTDIEKTILFFPSTIKHELGKQENQLEQEPGESYFNIVLGNLIAYKVVYLEYKDEFELVDEDYEIVQAPVIRTFGSFDNLVSRLRTYDMTWTDFKSFIKERVLYEKVLRERLQVNIDIEFKEIEKFYLETYVPQQEKLNLKPKSLIEMAPLIEENLRQARTDEKLASWLKEITLSHRIEKKILQEMK